MSGTSTNRTYTPGAGGLRIWTEDGGVVRNGNQVHVGGNFISSSVYDATNLGFSMNNLIVTSYVEGIWGSASVADQHILVEVDPDGSAGAGFVHSDAVRVTLLELTFSSDETGNLYLPAFNGSTNVARLDEFRFLVGENRAILGKVSGSLDRSFTFEVVGDSIPAIPPVPALGNLANSGFSFTPNATLGNRPLGTTAIPAVRYTVSIKNSLGTVVVDKTISQDLIDRVRQEYIDRFIHHGTGFTAGSIGLVSHAPSRDEVKRAPSIQVGGPGPIGNCRDWPNPNYTESGIGIVWDQGSVDLINNIRLNMGPDTVCLHSGHRSPSHNQRVNGATNSDHQWGRAADMSYENTVVVGTVAAALFHLRLYRVALGETTGQILLELNSA